MLHDVRDVVPGIQELVEAHRSRRPSAAEVEALTFSVVERRYALLLGLRRARYWTTLRPRAFAAAFESLRAAYGVVVCDVTADLEGEDEVGSADVEERNLMARTVVPTADVVFAVGRPGVKGVHALVRVLTDLGRAGIPAGRVVPVFNLAPRSRSPSPAPTWRWSGGSGAWPRRCRASRRSSRRAPWVRGPRTVSTDRRGDDPEAPAGGVPRPVS